MLKCLAVIRKVPTFALAFGKEQRQHNRISDENGFLRLKLLGKTKGV